MSTSPASISTMRLMARRSVVLPHPLGPRTMVSSPSGMIKRDVVHRHGRAVPLGDVAQFDHAALIARSTLRPRAGERARPPAAGRRRTKARATMGITPTSTRSMLVCSRPMNMMVPKPPPPTKAAMMAPAVLCTRAMRTPASTTGKASGSSTSHRGPPAAHAHALGRVEDGRVELPDGDEGVPGDRKEGVDQKDHHHRRPADARDAQGLECRRAVAQTAQDGHHDPDEGQYRQYLAQIEHAHDHRLRPAVRAARMPSGMPMTMAPMVAPRA